MRRPKPTPTASIVVASRNEGAWLQRTLDAILASEPEPAFEIVVVDDGSDDGSTEFLAGEPARYEQTRLVRGEKLGVAGARARGEEVARGAFLIFLDAHVLPERGWLSSVLRLLADPSVGIAGGAVRALADPGYLGHAYVPANERLNAAWAAPRGPAPFEVPAIIGCFFGLRRETYAAIGGFDPGAVGWGVDDIELSLRAWYMGYRCLVAPGAEVVHRFKENADRAYTVSWEEYDVNLLRCALTYFGGARLESVLVSAAERESFPRSLARVHEDGTYWDRRSWLRERFRYDEAWYFQRFANELAPLDRRLRHIMAEARRKQLMKVEKNVTCPQCGAMNRGVQDRCLLCQAPLPSPAAAGAVDVDRAASNGGGVCSKCGRRLAPELKFCTHCGHPR